MPHRTVAVVQAPAVRGRPGPSRRRYGRILATLDADIVLLPELALTGYDPALDYATLAETDDGETAAWARGWAIRLDALVAIGFPHRRADGAIENALVMAWPGDGGKIYAKRRLWGSEAAIFAAGTAPPPVVTFRGVRIAPLICYDMTFPAETARLAGRIDLLLAASAWPWLSPGHAAAGRDVARALATQLAAAVAWANQVGSCRVGTPESPRPDRGAGRSLVTLPYRSAEARCPARGRGAAVLSIDLARLRQLQADKLGISPKLDIAG
ncbi:MAG: carbon-nitrogen hydrolase family protein [Acidobacteria bacterium]|nr:carbon-nitrogen hydrolase family protein [Acidobacteriota bacterium]